MVKRYNSVKKRRAVGIRSQIRGTADRPRLTVFRSNQHIYAQAIDDVNRKTLVASSSLQLKVNKVKKIDLSALVGEDIAKKLQAKKVKAIIFDRGSYLYHGRVKNLAESMRKQGIKF